MEEGTACGDFQFSGLGTSRCRIVRAGDTCTNDAGFESSGVGRGHRKHHTAELCQGCTLLKSFGQLPILCSDHVFIGIFAMIIIQMRGYQRFRDFCRFIYLNVSVASQYVPPK